MPEFDAVAKLTNREMQVLMREVDRRDLVIALKGASRDGRGGKDGGHTGP